MHINDLLQRLDGVKQSGQDKWQARCPCKANHAHGDRNPSLSLKYDTQTGKILLKCQTGCSVEDICGALGITTRDLMPEPAADDRRNSFLTWYARENNLTLVDIYSYCYGAYQDGLAKVRFREADGRKTFRFIKADHTKKSGCSLTHEGCQNRLYFAGSADADPVFLVEGEKDADTMHRLTTCTAACTEYGATKKDAGDKWKPEYTSQLAGKTVYILGDNDEAGRMFADQEAKALAGHAHVYMLNILDAWQDCPEKGDISDLVEAFGLTEAQKRFAMMMNNAQERAQEAATPADDSTPHGETDPVKPPKTALQLFDDFMGKVQTDAYKPMQTGMPAFDRLLGGGIMRQALVILSAAPGTGKTTLAQQIFETAAAQGTDVIFFNLEMSREQLLARSLSRMVNKQGHSMTAADILRGYDWTDIQKEYVQDAADEYRSRIAPRMNYNPDGSGTDYESIMKTLDAAGEAAQAAGKPAPVVVLDYLHLVTSPNREEQGEIIKKTVARLKEYAIRFDSYVFAISANNRVANNSGVVSLASGRDTSAIEYSADYQLALNYKALAEKSQKPNGGSYDATNPDDMDELARQQPRQMLVQVLKNRMNAPGGKLYLAFDAANSVFYPIETKREEYPAFREIKEQDPDCPFV